MKPEVLCTNLSKSARHFRGGQRPFTWHDALLTIERLLLTLTIVVTNIFRVSPPAVSGRMFATQMSPNVVETQYGRIRGVLVSLPNKNLSQVEAYFGIQFASLLGSELRFMPPTSSMEKWDGIRVAMKYRPVCPQRIPNIAELEKTMPASRVEHYQRLLPFLDKQSEDCLHLNLYVPVIKASSSQQQQQQHDKNENKNDNTTSGSSGGAGGGGAGGSGSGGTSKSPVSSGSGAGLLPVLVFIHGEEAYDVGTGNAYDGSVLASYGQIIVVTINYRLGVLGFLSTGDSNAPGNYAILDQVAALHWIKENIQSFGGDPGSVTLLGHGHGAALVNFLLISPVTKGRNLFQKVILQSGSCLSSWSLTADPLRYTRELAAKVNCSVVNNSSSSGGSSGGQGQSAGLVQCLKHVAADALVKADIKAPKYLSAFGPTVDRRSVLPLDVRRMMSKSSTDSSFFNVKLLAGVTRNEGLVYLTQRDAEEGITTDRLRRILRTYVQNTMTYHRQYIYDVLTHQYTDWERYSDPQVMRDVIIDLLGDGQYVAPLIEMTQLHARIGGASTYLYSFNNPQAAFSPRTPDFTSGSDHPSRWAPGGGGAHGDDLMFAFGAPLTDGLEPFPSVYGKADRALAETVLKYWTNFIRTGNPNEHTVGKTNKTGNVKSVDVEWPQFDVEKQEYLHIERKPQDRSEDVTRSLGVRHHYKGSKMALWLQLVPQLHRPDNLDAVYHQLENFNNITTFEEEGTRWISLAELMMTTTPEPTTLAATTEATTEQSTTTTTTTLPASLSSLVLGESHASLIKRPPTMSTLKSSPSEGKDDKDDEEDDDTIKKTSDRSGRDGRGSVLDPGNSLSLSMTVGVGCALLFLNILVFAAVYYQKDRLRTERRLRKRDERLEAARERQCRERETTSIGGGGEHTTDHKYQQHGGGTERGNGIDSTGGGVNYYTNCVASPTQIPPAPLPISARGQQQLIQQQQQQQQQLHQQQQFLQQPPHQQIQFTSKHPSNVVLSPSSSTGPSESLQRLSVCVTLPPTPAGLALSSPQQNFNQQHKQLSWDNQQLQQLQLTNSRIQNQSGGGGTYTTVQQQSSLQPRPPPPATAPRGILVTSDKQQLRTQNISTGPPTDGGGNVSTGAGGVGESRGGESNALKHHVTPSTVV